MNASRIRRNILILATVLVAIRSAGVAEKYSCKADLFVTDNYAQKPSVLSPDRSKRLSLWSKPQGAEPDTGSFFVSVYSNGRPLKTIKLRDLSAGTFIKWSPDSRAFYVMWSNGGMIGGYSVRAFSVENDLVTELPGPKAVAAEFARHYYCRTRGNNLFAVRWVDDSSQLLMKAQVYPTSDCGRYAGHLAGYLVNTSTGEIRRKYTQKEVDQISEGCPSGAWPTGLWSANDLQKAKEAEKK